MNLLVILLRLEGKFHFLLQYKLLHLKCYAFFGNSISFIFFIFNSDLLALHRIATLRHDELGQVCGIWFWTLCFHVNNIFFLCAWFYDYLQETILNLLLRNYLHYNLYDQAEKLRSKAPRFEAHSNQQATLYIILFVHICLFVFIFFF